MVSVQVISLIGLSLIGLISYFTIRFVTNDSKGVIDIFKLVISLFVIVCIVVGESGICIYCGV